MLSSEYRIQLPYGSETVTANLQWARSVKVLDIATVPELEDCDASIQAALEQPIGLDRNIFQIVRPGERVCILVSDAFRQTRADQVLPVLVDGLSACGIDDASITILFATGTHRAPRPDEQERILGHTMYHRLRANIRVHDAHDATAHVLVGTTRRGTPVWIDRIAQEADRVIATGAVVLHYFGGFGGGRKSFMPGIASVETIAHNHAMNLDPVEDRRNPAVRIGSLDGNPVAEDMLEAARLAQCDYIVNTVLTRDGRIAGIFAGELEAAHRVAATFAEKMYTVPIGEQADVVIASAGSAKNYVQSHKALYNAYQAVKPSGRIIFLAKCEEGLGGEQFAKWMRLGSREAIIAGLRKQAEINGQTALSTIEKVPITTFITDISDDDMKALGARRASSLQAAIDEITTTHKYAGATVYVMPSASYTVPNISTPAK